MKIAELKDNVGAELGTSGWHEISQERVQQFAEATNDHQWIHVDPDLAKQGPFGTTIAHGYLTLSLIPFLMSEVWRIEDAAMGVNYGLNKVRFPAPVPTGSRVRLHAKLLEVEEVARGVQIVVQSTIEVEGGEKPVCVAETVSRVYGGQED
jgi:acyl dehydratase